MPKTLKMPKPVQLIRDAVEHTINYSIDKEAIRMHGRAAYVPLALGLAILRYADWISGGDGLRIVIEAAASAAEDANAHKLAGQLYEVAKRRDIYT